MARMVAALRVAELFELGMSRSSELPEGAASNFAKRPEFIQLSLTADGIQNMWDLIAEPEGAVPDVKGIDRAQRIRDARKRSSNWKDRNS